MAAPAPLNGKAFGGASANEHKATTTDRRLRGFRRIVSNPWTARISSAVPAMKLRPIIAIMIAICTVTQVGCSFLFVEGPPAPDGIPFRRMDDSFCAESKAAPVADLVVAGAVPLVGLARVMEPGNSTGLSSTEAAVAITSVLVVSGVELASSIWGFYTTGKCRRYTARALRSERTPQGTSPIHDGR